MDKYFDFNIEINLFEHLKDMDASKLDRITSYIEYLKSDPKPSSGEPKDDIKPVYLNHEHEEWIDIDIDDIYWDMSSSEKEYLYERLGEDIDIHSIEETHLIIEDIFSSGTTETEREFGQILYQLWESRLYLSKEQKDRIMTITKEPYV